MRVSRFFWFRWGHGKWYKGGVDQLRVSVSGGDSYIVVTLAGESDVYTYDQLRGTLEAETAKGVALLIVDATIESEKSADRLRGQEPDASASEEDVARAVAYLAAQSPRAWTHELTITPRLDRWVP